MPRKHQYSSSTLLTGSGTLTNVKTCTKCNEDKNASEFYADKRGHNGLMAHCKECHKGYVKQSSKPYKKPCVECSMPTSRTSKSGMCRKCKDAKRRFWSPDRYGYLRMTVDGVVVYQHRQAMEAFIGRPLNEDESVHHKNGDRTDNRIENLELWSRWQPAGQRVEDKVEWAVELLERYAPERLAIPK